MRHFRASALAIATLAFGMGEATAACFLVTPAGLALGLTAGGLRAALAAVTVAPVAVVSVSTIIDVVSCTIFDRCAGMIRPSLPAGRGNEDEPQAPQGERGDQRRWRMARWMV
jgi:hypothetical protein